MDILLESDIINNISKSLLSTNHRKFRCNLSVISTTGMFPDWQASSSGLSGHLQLADHIVYDLEAHPTQVSNQPTSAHKAWLSLAALN